ncbi:MAG: VOC family protein [Sedimenticola sp.]
MAHTDIDHLVITSPTLEMGAQHVIDALGVEPQPGGEHVKMGTHNLLLRLGNSTYLEVIAKNPEAPAPGRPRWFSLDKVDEGSLPLLATWVARTADIEAAVAACLEDVGDIVSMNRGDLDWRITIPQNGELLLDGVAPSLIEWQTARHPAEGLVDHGLRLLDLELHHPEQERVSGILKMVDLEGPVTVKRCRPSEHPHLQAIIETPHGIRRLK